MPRTGTDSLEAKQRGLRVENRSNGSHTSTRGKVGDEKEKEIEVLNINELREGRT